MIKSNFEKGKIVVGGSIVFVKGKENVVFGGGKNECGQKTHMRPIPKKFQNGFFKSIVCTNSEHVLFLSNNGRCFGKGQNYYGQLGVKSVDNKPQKEIKEIEFFKNKTVISIFTGYSSSFFELDNEKFFACGNNEYGQLGLDSEDEEVFEPREIDFSILEKDERIIDIQGALHTIALTNKENVYCCGKESALGEEYKGKVFKKMKFFAKKNIKITQICCSRMHSLYLTSTNRVYSAGINFHCQLGIDQKKGKKKLEFYTPQHISSLPDVIKIQCGETHSFFVTKENRIFCCGTNHSFHLGFKDEFPGKEYPIPVEISYWGSSDLKNDLNYRFKDVFCGWETTFFINYYGEIFSVGYGERGELANGSKTEIQKTPIKIKGVMIDVHKENELGELIHLNSRKTKLENIIIKTR